MEKINLKSNLLIKLFGKSIITFEEMQEVEDLLLDGEGIAFSDEEIANIQNDLEFVFYDIKENMKGISIVNCPNSLRDYIINNAPTTEILFEDYEEFFDDLKSKKVNVSDEFKKYFGELESNEYQLFNYIKSSQMIGIKPVIRIQDYELIKKYAKISDFEVKIESMEEYEALLGIVGNENLDILVGKDLLNQLENKEIIDNLNINLELKDMSELSVEELESISQNIDIKSIYIPADNGVKEPKDCYSKDDYILLRNEIENILIDVDNSKPEIDRFIKIYQILGNMIEYEYDDDGKPSARSLAHNLKGGLLEGKCVCEGYSKILQQVLKCSGIDCKYIPGNTDINFDDDDKHAWNQVRIDEVWYNCDLTWDADRIRENRPLEYCLQGDDEFISHYTKSNEKMECSKTYDRNKINKYLNYFTAPEFEERKYEPEEIIQLFKDIKDYGTNGIRASMQLDVETGSYCIMVGNIIEDNEIKWSDNKILIEDLEEFFTQYIDEFPTEGIEKRRNSKFYKKQYGC